MRLQEIRAQCIVIFLTIADHVETHREDFNIVERFFKNILSLLGSLHSPMIQRETVKIRKSLKTHHSHSPLTQTKTICRGTEIDGLFDRSDTWWCCGLSDKDARTVIQCTGKTLRRWEKDFLLEIKMQVKLTLTVSRILLLGRMRDGEYSYKRWSQSH